MKKFKAIKVSSGKVMSEWTSDFADEKYYEENWGKLAHDEAIFDVDGKTIIDTIHHEAEYIVEILDITAEVEAERTKKKTKHADRLSRIEQLKAIDWAKVNTVAELKNIVKLLAKEAIKDEE